MLNSLYHTLMGNTTVSYTGFLLPVAASLLLGLIFAMIFVYILALQYLGFIVSTLTFIIAGVLVYGGGLKSAILTGVPVTAGVYLVFHVLLKVPMPQGLLI